VCGNSTKINHYEGTSSHRKYYFLEEIKDHLSAVHDTVYGDSTKVIQFSDFKLQCMEILQTSIDMRDL
jgi:hypothetical protein